MDVYLPKGTTYILVIDTDSYAGNFEREIAGYTTGICDHDRYHGDTQAAEAARVAPDMVAALQAKSLAVRHAEYGMVTNTIRATPGRLNNGFGFAFPANDPVAAEEAAEKAKDAARNYNARQIEMAQRRLDTGDFETNPNGWTKEACERTIVSALGMIERAGQSMTTPAFESVAMFFSEPLTAQEMAFVRERAEAFASAPDGTGRKPFRILDVYQVETSQSVESRVVAA